MRLLGLIACMGMVVALTSGCTTSVPKPPPVAPVKGTVLLDSKPMASGEVEFEITGYPSKTLKIENGAFSGEAYSGKNTLRFHMWKDGPPISTDPEKKPRKIESLPAQHNANSGHSVDIPEAGSSDLKFAITSR